MKPLRTPVVMLPSLLIAAILAYSPIGSYLIEQGVHFYDTVILATPIEEMRERKDLDKSTRKLFDRVEEIRRFAYNELGLEPSSNFTHYTELDRDHLVSVVSAVREDSMQRHIWYYPLFGGMFYRGFYDPADAQEEARRLERKGYDTLVREVNAFSSLGYFPDPVYSFMADYSDYRLASLIIHEEMHANLWIENQNSYNEEIATFVADEGAARFIAHKYGEDSEEYQQIARRKADRESFRQWNRELYRDLSSAYRSLRTREERLEAKERIFASARESISENYDHMFLSDGYRHLADRPMNNAVVDASYSYAGDLSLYYALFEQFDYNLAGVIELIRESGEAPQAPRTYLSTTLEGIRLGTRDISQYLDGAGTPAVEAEIPSETAVQ